MKKSYVKPVLNSSMEGTLEGVYAYGQAGCYGFGWKPCYHRPCQPEKRSSNNGSETPQSRNKGISISIELIIGWFCGRR